MGYCFGLGTFAPKLTFYNLCLTLHSQLTWRALLVPPATSQSQTCTLHTPFWRAMCFCLHLFGAIVVKRHPTLMTLSFQRFPFFLIEILHHHSPSLQTSLSFICHAADCLEVSITQYPRQGNDATNDATYFIVVIPVSEYLVQVANSPINNEQSQSQTRLQSVLVGIKAPITT